MPKNKEEHVCSNCKHCDKKITAEPCMICGANCDKWEAKYDKATL